MNKQVLITLAVVVGLLALWLMIAVLYPQTSDEQMEEQDVEEVVDEEAARGGSGTVTTTVQIVESVNDLPQTAKSNVDAFVSITD